jgi:Bacterial SH3 domain
MAASLTALQDEESLPSALDAEAMRLLQFKREKIRKGNMTPCPECATLISVNANKCPHCTSNITDQNQKIRSELNKLNELSVQLYDLHKRQMELYRHQAEQKPFWQKSKELFTDPQVVQDLKVLLPTLISFFALLLFLRSIASGPVFWLVSVGGTVLVAALLKKWNVRKYLTIDLYRSVLVIVTAAILVASLDSTRRFWPEMPLAGNTTEAVASAANIRVVASGANIRAEPNTQANVVTTVNQGEDLRVLQENGSWYRVSTESGQTGWVHASLVR